MKDFFDSIINSTLKDIEVVIVDDGSTDGSVSILNEIIIAHPRVVVNLVKLPKNVGFANALNIGMKQCNGKYIARVDPDDKLYSSRLEKQYEFLERNTQIDVLGTNATLFSGSQEIFKSNMEANHDWIETKYKQGEHGVLHATVMIRASVFKRFSYCQQNVPAEDYDIFSRMIIAGHKFANLTEPLIYYRIHQSSVSNFLPFSTVEKTFLLCEEIFGIKNSYLKVKLAYYSRLNYRGYLFTGNRLNLFLAAFFNPEAVFRRLKTKIKNIFSFVFK